VGILSLMGTLNPMSHSDAHLYNRHRQRKGFHPDTTYKAQRKRSSFAKLEMYTVFQKKFTPRTFMITV